jgi:GNAT superfamily N-acetyltransferase
MRFGAPGALRPDNNVESFDCGNEALDAWLRQRALRNEREDASRTYVVVHEGRVIAYYALAVAAIPHAGATGRARRNMPDPIPAMLLARLAVDTAFQGHQLGANLLRDAIRRTLAAADIAGIRVLLVHAVDERARMFYEHFGFEASPTDELHLMLVLKDARNAGFA